MKGTVSQDYDHILICAPAKPAPREVIRQVKQRIERVSRPVFRL